jgi:hypothetical protein
MGQDPSTNSTVTTETQQWFREPTPRERRMAAALFVGFGCFFVMLFLVLNGWWFRWVILGLAIISVAYACGHVQELWRLRKSGD